MWDFVDLFLTYEEYCRLGACCIGIFNKLPTLIKRIFKGKKIIILSAI